MRNSRALRGILSLGMVVGLGATGTYAYWTDQATITGTTITAGTIDLKASTDGGTTYVDNPSDFTTMNVQSMVPGDTTAGVITIKNTGTAPLKYWIDASGSNADTKGLAAALVAKVTLDTATSGNQPAVTCAGAAVGGSGTTFSTSLMGTSTTGRLLAAGATEKICIQAGLPSSANTSLQGATTDLTFTVTGTSF